ncbi:hypothetical protein [Luteimonas sp. FCS-9]|uniref:hypothetical protein n=1 Tax=Luteimonas sp. FCS-9 TaxID=1547516 RepID=UPI00063EB6AF|nr:hypothetical protein [Luteimonas sp. FCS-9]KLI99745.1 hypothetical protein WQ56_11365 [Luteimonas sp. FCS-9]
MSWNIAVTVAFAMAVCACTSTGTPTTGGGVPASGVTVLTARHDPDAVALTAQRKGILAIERGCIVVRTGEVSSRVVLPRTFALWTEGDRAMGIHDTTHDRRFRFGTPLVLGGGQVEALGPEVVDARAGAACGPPYFVVGDVQSPG